MTLCAVIPAHNEALWIGPLVERLCGQKIDVFVIDDGSLDATSSIAAKSGAQVLLNERRLGKGGSLRRGFGHVARLSYDGVFVLDGDGQHDPGDLPGFMALAQQHSRCLITGNRMNNCRNMPFVRRCTNRLMSWMISCACGQTIPDTQCGFRYLSMSTLRELNLQSDEFEIETEMLIRASRLKIPVFSVPIRTIYGQEKSKINPLKDTVRFFKFFFKAVMTK